MSSLHAELLALQQMQQHAGVERAAARAHHQTVERGEAHRRGDAAQSAHRAEARAAAEVRDDRAPARGVAVALGERDRHVLVGQAVKAVAPHAAFPQGMRQRATSARPAAACGESGVEARHLRQVRQPRRAAPRSPAARTAGAAARAVCSSSGLRAPRGRRGPVPRTCCRRGPRGAPPPPAAGRPSAARRAAHAAAARRGRACRGRARAAPVRHSPATSLALAPPMPSTWPRPERLARQRIAPAHRRPRT